MKRIIQIADLHHYRNDQMNRVYSPEGVAPTLKTVTGGGREVKILDQRFTAAAQEYSNALTTVQKDALVSNGSDVRKLTPKEYFRLMGFDDADIDLLVRNGISNSQLYKMAGNSIAVNMLEFLFCQIFDSNNEIWV